jgi:hypothetical protein
MSKAKLPFEATGYLLYYFAAHAADAVGKEQWCAAIVDRTTKWHCTPVNGSHGSYEFGGLTGNSIAMRYLPCPCQSCFNNNPGACTNLTFTDKAVTIAMRLIEIDCPDTLQLPLSKYTILILTSFLRLYEIKLPKDKKKPSLIATITEKLGQYIE